MTVPSDPLEPPPGPLPPPRRSRESVLRQAWGTYFGIWALAILAMLLVGSAALLLPTPGSSHLGVSLTYLVIAIVAGLVTVRYFRGVWQRTHFPLWKVGRAFLLSFALLAVGLVAASLSPTLLGAVVLSAMVLSTAVLMAYELRWSLGRVPGEGWVAVGALSLSAVGGVAGWMVTGNLLVYGGFWLLTVLVWAACAVAAWVHEEAPPIPARPARAP